MGQLHGPGAGDNLVVGSLVLDLLLVFTLLKENACAHEGHVQQHINLVEGQPVLHLLLESVEDGGAVF